MKSLLLTAALVLASLNAFGAEDSQPVVPNSGSIAESTVVQMYASQGDQVRKAFIQSGDSAEMSGDVWGVAVNQSIYSVVVSKSKIQTVGTDQPVAVVSVYYVAEEAPSSN